MSLAAVAGAIVGVALVFSGALKLFHPAWPRQARALGAPGWTAVVVPWAELALGSLVAVGLGQPSSGLAVAALLGAFTALLVANLRRGRRPPCACFGRLSERPIGWGDVVRNLLLVALAVLAALGA